MRERGRRWVGFLWRGPPVRLAARQSCSACATSAPSDPRPVEDILAVSGGGTDRLVMMSPSAADDGGFVAMADVTRAAGLAEMGAGLPAARWDRRDAHILRLGIDVPLRRTGDADFGVPPHVLKSGRLVEELEAMGYRKRAVAPGSACSTDGGRRRPICSYLRTPHGRESTRRSTATGQGRDDEVPGLAEALRRTPVRLPVRFVLSDRRAIETEVLLPDAVECCS